VDWAVAVWVAAGSNGLLEVQESASFLKKRSKKLTFRWDLALSSPRPAGTRSFSLLFFKKEALALFFSFQIGLQ
jgi:hypothetical protein